jgi:hypothetical protein
LTVWIISLVCAICITFAHWLLQTISCQRVLFKISEVFSVTKLVAVEKTFTFSLSDQNIDKNMCCVQLYNCSLFRQIICSWVSVCICVVDFVCKYSILVECVAVYNSRAWPGALRPIVCSGDSDCTLSLCADCHTHSRHTARYYRVRGLQCALCELSSGSASIIIRY